MRGGYDNVIMSRFRNGLQGFFEPSAQLAGAGDNRSGAGHAGFPASLTARRGTMKNPLDSLWGTVIAGVVLTIVLYAVARIAMGS